MTLEEYEACLNKFCTTPVAPKEGARVSLPTPTDKAIASLYMRYTLDHYEAWPSVDRIVRVLNVSESSVRRVRRRMVRVGIARVVGSGGGRQTQRLLFVPPRLYTENPTASKKNREYENRARRNGTSAGHKAHDLGGKSSIEELSKGVVLAYRKAAMEHGVVIPPAGSTGMDKLIVAIRKQRAEIPQLGKNATTAAVAAFIESVLVWSCTDMIASRKRPLTLRFLCKNDRGNYDNFWEQAGFFLQKNTAKGEAGEFYDDGQLLT